MLTRALTPEEFAVFIVGLALQSYMFALGCMGTRAILLRELMLRADAAPRLFTAYISVTGVSSLVAAVVLTVATCATQFTVSERLVLVLFALGNVSSCLNIVPLYDARQRHLLSAQLSVMCDGLLALTLGVLLALQALSLATAGLAFLGKWLTVTVIHYAVYSRWLEPLRLAWDRREVGTLLRASWPLALATLVAMIPLHFGTFFLRALADPQETARLGLGAQAASAYLLLAAVGVRHLQSRLTLAEVSKKHLYLLALGYVLFLLLLLLGALIGVLVVIKCFLSSVYEPAIPAAACLLVGAFVSGIGLIAGALLVCQGKTAAIPVGNGVAATVYLSVTPLVVESQGALGAAVMTALTFGLGTTVLLFRLWSTASTTTQPVIIRR